MPVSAMRGAGGRPPKNVKWTSDLVSSEVEAHPDLLTVPTFILFVQKDELAMSRAEVRKLERRESQKEFEDWLYHQTQPRAPTVKKQGMNEESQAPVDDKERSAVAVRKPQAPPGKQGAGQRITRPSSDGFRVGQRPMGPAPQMRAWNSQRGARPPTAVDAASPPRSRAMTMADTLSDPANQTGSNTTPTSQTQSRSPSRKTPTPRGTPRNGTPPPRNNGRPKTPTPRAGKSPTPRPRAQMRPPQTPPKRPPSARKPASNRNHNKVGHA